MNKAITITAAAVVVAGVGFTTGTGKGAAQDAAASPDQVQRLITQIKRERRTNRVQRNLAYHRGYQRGRRSVVVSTDVQDMIRAVAANYGVSIQRSLFTAGCESTFRPGARNGRFLGVYQLGNGPGDPWYASTGHRLEAAGFTRVDALPNILATIAHVQRRGWGQWECGGFIYR